MNLSKPEHEVTCSECQVPFICACGIAESHATRAQRFWSDPCPSCVREMEEEMERFTNPNPLCEKCGRHRAFCKHSGFEVREHVKELPVVPR